MIEERLRVRWFTRWNADLEHALLALPEMEACPRDLYRLLLSRPGRAIALVTQSDAPMALVGLRQRSLVAYQPVTHWILPGTPFPALPGMALRALDALNVRVKLAWWRMDAAPFPPTAHAVYRAPVHRIRTSEDFEAYWRSSGLLRSVKHSRRRCAAYRWALNPPGGAAWVIRNWSRRWRGEDPGREGVLRDRILIAEALERANRHFTEVLYDGSEIIGGITHIVHRDASVAGVMHYLPERRGDGVGTRLMEMLFHRARESGRAWIDVGGGHDYKAQWAPVRGEKAEIAVSPAHLRLLCSAAALVRRMSAARADAGAAPVLAPALRPQGAVSAAPLGARTAALEAAGGRAR